MCLPGATVLRGTYERLMFVTFVNYPVIQQMLFFVAGAYDVFHLVSPLALPFVVVTCAVFMPDMGWESCDLPDVALA